MLASTLPGAVVFGAAALSGISFPGSIYALFYFTFVITVGCAALALYVLKTARKTDLPELGVLAAGLFAVSVLPMVHALTLPGVLYGPNNAVMFGAWAGLPLGLVIAAPTLLKPRPFTTRILRHWRGYTTGTVVATAALCAFLLISPNTLPAPSPLNWWTLLGAAFGLTGAVKLSLRQAGLYEVGQRLPSLVAALGFGYIGMSSLVWLVGDPLGLASWLAHGFDGFGVLLAGAGLWLAHRSDTQVADIFAPVLTREPLMALRLGVSPQVTAFLKDLATKDASTRAHVVRVAELAMVLGENDAMAGAQLRDLGLGAILHDIGKIRVPDAILKKPGALNDGEYEQMKLHTVWGDEILRCDPEFVEVAQLVRGHHERPDGRGYPDGLSAHEIPVASNIISVCDAWDAMVQDRHYRNGMGTDKARAILNEHAGSQWSEHSVDLLLAAVDDGWEPAGTFEDLGAVSVCGDALPVA